MYCNLVWGGVVECSCVVVVVVVVVVLCNVV